VAPRDGARATAWCWSDRCSAFDEGDEAAAWFSGSSRARCGWCVRRRAPAPGGGALGGRRADAPGSWSRFSDGYPVLLLSQASVDGLDARLAAAGRPPVDIARSARTWIVSGAHRTRKTRWRA
jgi:uncharacterized protein YcbX